MFAIPSLVALTISAAAGLPADWARRRSSREAASTLNLLNAAGMLAADGAAAALGIAGGIASLVTLVLGVVSGQQLAGRSGHTYLEPGPREPLTRREAGAAHCRRRPCRCYGPTDTTGSGMAPTGISSNPPMG